MIAASMACLVCLAGCAQPPAPSPDAVADGEAHAAGSARGNDVRVAKACGADPRRWTVEEKRATAPLTYSIRQSVIYAGAVKAARVNGPAPEPAECQAIKADPAYASLFSAPRRAAATPSRPPRSGPDQPSYCAEGSIALEQDSSLTAGLASIATKCRTGDSIIIPADAIGVIASACDLSKPVAATGQNVFCTVGRLRPMRTSGS